LDFLNHRNELSRNCDVLFCSVVHEYEWEKKYMNQNYENKNPKKLPRKWSVSSHDAAATTLAVPNFFFFPILILNQGRTM